MSRTRRALLMWLFVALFFGGFWGHSMFPYARKYYELSNFNRVATGEIVEVFPKMHNTCKYRYVVENREYTQTGSSCGYSPIGKKINVYFSPSDFQEAVNEDPKSLLSNEIISFALGILLMPTIAAAGVYWRNRSKGEGRNPTS